MSNPLDRVGKALDHSDLLARELAKFLEAINEAAKPFTLHREVTEADRERTTALVGPELMDELRQRKANPPPVIDNGEWDYDGDGGREHADNDKR